MVVLVADEAAMAGNCKTLIAMNGETLRVGDRVEVTWSGWNFSAYGFVLGKQGDYWSVWVNG